MWIRFRDLIEILPAGWRGRFWRERSWWWMWKGLSFIWFKGWLRCERFVWLMVSFLSVISHYNGCRVSRDVLVRVVSSIRRLMLSTWIIFLHLERVGFLYINRGNRMTWFQFYFKIFVLDRLLLILHSEERDESENGLRGNSRRECLPERKFWKKKKKVIIHL